MIPDNIMGQKTVEELKEEYINNPVEYIPKSNISKSIYA